jgi:hypothetical protein
MLAPGGPRRWMARCFDHTNSLFIILWAVPSTISARLKKFNKEFWEELIAYFFWYDTNRVENDMSTDSSIVARGILCRGNAFTEPMPSSDREGIHIYEVHRWDDAGGMIYVPSFIKTGSGYQKLITGGGGDKQTAWWSHKPAFIYFSK